jgi:hypothetical protein
LKPATAGFLLGLFFDHGDGNDMFLRNVGLSPGITVYKTVLFIVTAVRSSNPVTQFSKKAPLNRTEIIFIPGLTQHAPIDMTCSVVKPT